MKVLRGIEYQLPQTAATRLAAVLGREHGFSHTSLSRYLKGRLGTSNITMAFATAMGMPLPIQIMPSIEASDWLAVGMRLQAQRPETFRLMLETIETIVGK
ncbi:MAG: hypothetical protein ACPGVG_00420 [Mycobacterium sp.]